MNILIPMAGLGSRFPNHILPKPLIDVNGMTMIEAAIKTLGLNGNLIFIVRQSHIEQYNIDNILKSIFNCTVISVEKLTDGPACTALLARDFIDNDDPLIIANCDQIMKWDPIIFQSFCENYPHDGFLVTYYSKTEKNSYVRLGYDGLVKEVKEKEVISNVSTNGIHFWKKGKYFVESTFDMIELNDTAPNGEFYVAPSYNHMIKKGKKVGIYHIPNSQHWAIGTEEDLGTYLEIFKNN